MEEAEGLQSDTNEGLKDQVNESLGVSDGAQSDEHSEPKETNGSPKETLAVQKRIKSLNRAHQREVSELHARIGELESRMTPPNTSSTPDQMAGNAYAPQNGDINHTIHQAVGLALQAKEEQERKARDAESQAHVSRKYQDFQKHLEGMNDKYEDFHEAVFDPHAKFTNTMRDYASTLPKQGAGSAGEVLYKLAKDPESLERIAKLHPHDQASEMSALSHALISGGENKGSAQKPPLGNIKSNPVTNSHAITDKTPVGSIRERMRSGTWK